MNRLLITINITSLLLSLIHILNEVGWYWENSGYKVLTGKWKMEEVEECDENAYRQSRHRPLLFPGHPKGCHRGEGRRRMARREGEIVRVRDKQLYLREDAAWTDAGHQRLEKKIAEDSVDEERRCQHTSDPPRFAEHQQHRCQRHPENTGVSQTGNKTHASIQHGAVQGLQELQESEFGVHKAPSFSFRYVQDTRSL